MIRFKRLNSSLLDAWLLDQKVASSHDGYRLRVWREDRSAFAAIENELKDYFEEAFEDARKRIRRGFEDDLSPFNDKTTDPAANYPSMLHQVTLQGYFGEILAMVAVEHCGAHGHADWCIPAYLFRFHDVEFQHLESINERLRDNVPFDPDAIAELRPGRTGDDGIAFRRNGDDSITDILTIESKCLLVNNNGKIVDAHQKLSAGLNRPSGIREIINLLEEYDTPEAQSWQKSLLKLWKEHSKKVRRYDSIGYTCGRIPTQKRRIDWLPSVAPHTDYTAKRNLEGMEFQFSDLPSVITAVYRGG